MKRKHTLQDFLRFILPRSNSQVNDSTLHILMMNKKEYVDTGVRCAGSFLDHNPGFRVSFYVDKENEGNLRRKIKRWKLSKISQVEVLPSEKPWQLHKLEIILKNITSNDFFCDADLYWNGQVNQSLTPLCFVREEVLSENGTYKKLLEILGLTERSFAMFNTSVVALGQFAQNESLRKEAIEIYTKIVEICEDSSISLDQRGKILRLSEQIALSIAFSYVFKGNLKFLKEIDSPMDGGVAESFYLGTTRGWR
jgi:sulfur carrier protein ThiS